MGDRHWLTLRLDLSDSPARGYLVDSVEDCFSYNTIARIQFSTAHNMHWQVGF